MSKRATDPLDRCLAFLREERGEARRERAAFARAMTDLVRSIVKDRRYVLKMNAALLNPDAIKALYAARTESSKAAANEFYQRALAAQAARDAAAAESIRRGAVEARTGAPTPPSPRVSHAQAVGVQ